MKKDSVKTSMIQVTASELSKVENNSLNKDQLNVLTQGTPSAHIYTRPAKGGGTWNYVTGTYVKKQLNILFGWNWDFEIVSFEYIMEVKQCIVLGKLTVRTVSRTIIKNQFGRQDIKMKKDKSGPLDLGNDLKGAATDALKKCASELGIAADVYAPNEFKAIQVVDEKTQEEIDAGKVRNRIINHIDISTTIDKLSQVMDRLDNDQELWGLYNAKFKQLSDEQEA